MIMFLLVLGFWGVCCVQNKYLIFSICVVYSIFLMLRFKKALVLIIWILLCGVSVIRIPMYHKADTGEYTVTKIKNNYCLASNKNTKIVIYDPENANFGDVYSVTSFQEIHSIRNLNQFCFEEYMHKQNIYESADDLKKIQSSSSIQSRLYTYFMSKDLKEYYKLYLYGIYNDEVPAILSRLSLPILCVLYWIEKQLKKKFNDFTSNLIIVIFSILFGIIFTFKLNLIRYIIFKIGKMLFDKWEYSFSFSMLVLILLQYDHITEFAIVLPISIQLINRFIESKRMKTIYSALFLIFYQFIYFHEMDILFTLFFTIIRNWNAVLFVLCLFFPTVFRLLSSIPITVPSISFHFLPDIIFSILFISLLISLFQKKNRLCCLIMLVLYPGVKPYIDPFFHVYMLDIGQGDCTLIVEPFQKSVIMIDCGQNKYRDNVDTIILPVLKDLQIDHIDYLIVTHDDFDHSGGVEELKKGICVKSSITDPYQKVEVDYPFYSLLPIREANEENDKSIVSYFTYDDLSYLWMGDASINIENQLMKQYKLKIDILKLGHHGSQTSSSYHFLEAIQCRIGLISVGYNNRYKHPSNRVIQDCRALHINVLQTKDVGMVHIFTWKSLSLIETANGLFSIYHRK